MEGYVLHIPHTRKVGLVLAGWMVLPGGHAVRKGFIYPEAADDIIGIVACEPIAKGDFVTLRLYGR